MNQRKPQRSSPPHPDPDTDHPPAGPHAKPELTDHDKTPGAGTLPSAGDTQVDTGTG
jgi:hypothetical protein